MTLIKLGQTLLKSLVTSVKFGALEDLRFCEDTLTLTSSAEELSIRRLNIVLATNSLGLLKYIDMYASSSKFEDKHDTFRNYIQPNEFKDVDMLLEQLEWWIKEASRNLERRYTEYLVRINQYELFKE
jgi:hypothetical protein